MQIINPIKSTSYKSFSFGGGGGSDGRNNNAFNSNLIATGATHACVKTRKPTASSSSSVGLSHQPLPPSLAVVTVTCVENERYGLVALVDALGFLKVVSKRRLLAVMGGRGQTMDESQLAVAVHSLPSILRLPTGGGGSGGGGSSSSGAGSVITLAWGPPHHGLTLCAVVAHVGIIIIKCQEAGTIVSSSSARGDDDDADDDDSAPHPHLWYEDRISTVDCDNVDFENGQLIVETHNNTTGGMNTPSVAHCPSPQSLAVLCPHASAGAGAPTPLHPSCDPATLSPNVCGGGRSSTTIVGCAFSPYSTDLLVFFEGRPPRSSNRNGGGDFSVGNAPPMPSSSSRGGRSVGTDGGCRSVLFRRGGNTEGAHPNTWVVVKKSTRLLREMIVCVDADDEDEDGHADQGDGKQLSKGKRGASDEGSPASAALLEGPIRPSNHSFVSSSGDAVVKSSSRNTAHRPPAAARRRRADLHHQHDDPMAAGSRKTSTAATAAGGSRGHGGSSSGRPSVSFVACAWHPQFRITATHHTYDLGVNNTAVSPVEGEEPSSAVAPSVGCTPPPTDATTHATDPQQENQLSDNDTREQREDAGSSAASTAGGCGEKEEEGGHGSSAGHHPIQYNCTVTSKQHVSSHPMSVVAVGGSDGAVRIVDMSRFMSGHGGELMVIDVSSYAASSSRAQSTRILGLAWGPRMGELSTLSVLTADYFITVYIAFSVSTLTITTTPAKKKAQPIVRRRPHHYVSASIVDVASHRFWSLVAVPIPPTALPPADLKGLAAMTIGGGGLTGAGLRASPSGESAGGRSEDYPSSSPSSDDETSTIGGGTNTSPFSVGRRSAGLHHSGGADGSSGRPPFGISPLSFTGSTTLTGGGGGPRSLPTDGGMGVGGGSFAYASSATAGGGGGGTSSSRTGRRAQHPPLIPSQQHAFHASALVQRGMVTRPDHAVSVVGPIPSVSPTSSPQHAITWRIAGNDVVFAVPTNEGTLSLTAVPPIQRQWTWGGCTTTTAAVPSPTEWFPQSPADARLREWNDFLRAHVNAQGSVTLTFVRANRCRKRPTAVVNPIDNRLEITLSGQQIAETNRTLALISDLTASSGAANGNGASAGAAEGKSSAAATPSTTSLTDKVFGFVVKTCRRITRSDKDTGGSVQHSGVPIDTQRLAWLDAASGTVTVTTHETFQTMKIATSRSAHLKGNNAVPARLVAQGNSHGKKDIVNFVTF